MRCLKFRDKRGSSHFEMIASFILFFGFVLFLMIFIRPDRTDLLSGSVVSSLYFSFEQEVVTNLTTVFLMANSSTYYTEFNETNCFKVDLPEEAFGYGFSGSLVKNIEGIVRNSTISSQGILESLGNDSFYYVLISPEFADGGWTLSCNSVSDFVLGSLIDRQPLSYSKIEAISEKYRTNYSGLKDDLRFPAAFDFVISSEELSELNMERLIPSNEDVQAREYLEEVLLPDGSLINVKFNLRVW